jgi:ribosomal protein S18 acetylase RimI-like enzyme
MIEYRSSLAGINPDAFVGFGVGWRKPLTPELLYRVLTGSAHVWLTLDGERVVGFINAISDGCLMAYIPLLEVLPDYQDRGIGSELVRRMLETLHDLYGVDLCCDANVAPFYERFAMQRVTGMVLRNPARIT